MFKNTRKYFGNKLFKKLYVKMLQIYRINAILNSKMKKMLIRMVQSEGIIRRSVGLKIYI